MVESSSHETSADGFSVEHEHCCISRGRVISDVRLTQIGRGAWTLYTNHGVGNSRFAPTLPNRLFAFEVKDAGGKASLVLVNAVHADLEADQPFKALRELSSERGAPIRYIINPGPEHHLSLMAYAKAFPDAQICVAAGRIQRENPALCALDSVLVMPNGDVLPELSRMGMHVHVWGGWMEGAFGNRIQFRFGAPLGTTEPTVFWHEPSGVFINGGHGWFNWAAGDKPPPFPIRKILRLRQGHIVWSPVHYSVHDATRVLDGGRRILDWKFDSVFDLHVGLDQHMREAGRAEVEGLLRPLVDENWDALPFGHDTLQIPEGYVTGGDWKSYREVAKGKA